MMANLHQLQKGESEACLDNFYEDGSPPVQISLDPLLSPIENAQNFFRHYNKSKKIIENATLHAASTRDDLDYLSGVENSAELASNLDELHQVRIELMEQGFIKSPKSRSPKQREKEIPSPATFLSSDQFVILCGKNNRQNDYLTMKMAKPHDIWLHTREIPGSHIVIRTEGKNVPSTTLAEAASLAALFSKAKNSTKVPVDYTLRKNVSKPKGSKPGFVIYHEFKTIIIDPDPTLPEKLVPK